MQIWQAYSGSEGELSTAGGAGRGGGGGLLEHIATNGRGVDRNEGGGDRRCNGGGHLRNLRGRTTSCRVLGDG